MMTALNTLLVGAVGMASLIAATFFIRFWRATRDRFFLFFAASFATLSLDWVALALTDLRGETRHYLYMVRLFAFALIIAGAVDKNRRAR
jgi:hypothetical protein